MDTSIIEFIVQKLQDFSQRELSRPRVELLSSSNNIVVRASGDGEDLVLKALVDTDVDLDIWNMFAPRISDNVLTVPTLESRVIHGEDDSSDLPVLISKYVDWPNLVDWLSKNSFATIERSYVDICARVIELGMTLAPPREGFGPFKRNLPMYPSPQAYYAGQIKKFAARIADTGVDQPLDWRAFGVRMTEVFDRYLADEATFGIMPVDLNFKNFLVTDNNELVLLNIPIFIHGPLGHGLASAVLQARGQAGHEQVAEELVARFPGVRYETLALFECYNLLGVIAFYAHDGPEPILETPMWGSDQLLVDVMVETGRIAGIV